ncbi:MAG: RluA family pseudouridine synthase [Betaproteobacteria bacterium]|nr:RluA family pseudouridine synthase [Betaproteobacteria bacterium]
MPIPSIDLPTQSNLNAVENEELDNEVELRDLDIPTALHRHRLDRALVFLLPAFSRSHLKHLIEAGLVYSANSLTPVTKVAHVVKAAERYQVRLQPTDMSQAYLPQEMALEIVFEDEHLRVIDKPVGLVVHPAPGNWSGTLLNGLLALDQALMQVPRAGIVHRLDKDTSGLMVTARTRACMDALVAMIGQRAVHREYLAISPRPWRGAVAQEVALPIGRDPRNRLRMAVVDMAHQPGKNAHTTLQCHATNPQGSLVHCTLHTGRTHQIRVHMAAIGMPLLGDSLYGAGSTGPLSRQALHAFQLGFKHPISGEALHFQSPLPEDMQAALAQMGLPKPLS